MSQRAVVTLAVGRPLFVEYAVNLARSFLWWHSESAIGFAFATDQPHLIPEDLRERVEILPLAPGQYGEGFTPKLYLDEFAPRNHTLFLDADSLVVGPLESVFDTFAGRPVAVIGGTISEGDWFGDIGRVRRGLGLGPIPKFNGGVYYLEKGDVATAVYQTARSLVPRYDELGLVRLRGKPNEELLMALALTIHGLAGIREDGSIMAEPLNFATGLSLDVLRGRARLENRPGHARYQSKWPLHVAHPRIVHFLGYHTDRHPYTTEARRLNLMAAGKPVWFAWASAALTHAIPARLSQAFKSALRPAYHALFGARSIVPSSRG